MKLSIATHSRLRLSGAENPIY